MNTTTKSVVAKNLQRHLDAANMSRSDLARKLDVTPATVSYWLKAHSAPRADMVDRICKVLKITRADLTLDHDELSRDRATSKSIPLYNSIYAEETPFTDSNIVKYFALDNSIKADFGIIVSSSSMTGAGADIGDIVFFDKEYTFVEGNIYAVWVIGANSTAFKRVFIRDDKYILVSEHPNTFPLVIGTNEAFIIGEMVGLYKRWKKDEKVQIPQDIQL